MDKLIEKIKSMEALNGLNSRAYKNLNEDEKQQVLHAAFKAKNIAAFKLLIKAGGGLVDVDSLVRSQNISYALTYLAYSKSLPRGQLTWHLINRLSALVDEEARNVARLEQAYGKSQQDADTEEKKANAKKVAHIALVHKDNIQMLKMVRTDAAKFVYEAGVDANIQLLIKKVVKEYISEQKDVSTRTLLLSIAQLKFLAQVEDAPYMKKFLEYCSEFYETGKSDKLKHLYPLYHTMPTPTDMFFDQPIPMLAIATALWLSTRSNIYKPHQIAEAAYTVAHYSKTQDCKEMFADQRLIEERAINIIEQIPECSEIMKSIKNIDLKGCSMVSKQHQDAADLTSGILPDGLVKINKDDMLHAFRSTSKFCSLVQTGVLRIGDKFASGVYGSVHPLTILGEERARPVIIKKVLIDLQPEPHPKDLKMEREYYDSFNEVRKHAIVSSMNLEHIPMLRGFMVCDNITYSIMDKIDGKTLADTIDDISGLEIDADQKIKRINCILFQVLYTLYMLGKKYAFTHYDLHANNVLVETGFRDHIICEVEGVPYKVPTYGYRAYIIDFGMSRVEFKGLTIAKNTTGFEGYGIKTTYNPVYDLVRLRHGVNTDEKNMNALVKNQRLHDIMPRDSQEPYYMGNNINFTAADIINDEYQNYITPPDIEYDLQDSLPVRFAKGVKSLLWFD
jgi:serine/threonine protein kinase